MGQAAGISKVQVSPEVLGIRAGHRVAVIMDGVTTFHQCRDLGFDMNYSAFLTFLQNDCDLDLNRALYFNAVPPDPEEYSPVRKLIDNLDHNGFRVHIKVSVEGSDVAGRTGVRERNVVELAVEMISAADKVDTIILFASDPELVYAVERTQLLGARVVLIGNSSQVNEKKVHEDLRRSVDRFVELNAIRGAITMRELDPETGRRKPFVAPSVPVAAPARRVGSTQAAAPRPDEGEAHIVSDRRPQSQGHTLDLSRVSPPNR